MILLFETNLTYIDRRLLQRSGMQYWVLTDELEVVGARWIACWCHTK